MACAGVDPRAEVLATLSAAVIRKLLPRVGKITPGGAGRAITEGLIRLWAMVSSWLAAH
jgi:hypothetical protein